LAQFGEQVVAYSNLVAGKISPCSRLDTTAA
jgi:hypothetical protein